ncbi:MAG TPA: tetratricopeptide repeat protein, partial [Pyrinomonadaceae bacterium]
IINEILRAVAREYAWDEFLPPAVETITLAPEKLESYAGRYLINPDRVFKVTREGARLFAETTQSPRFELLPITETTFIRTDANVRYTFAPAAEGKPATFSLRQPDGSTPEAPRMAADAVIPYELLTGGKSAEAVEAYRKLKKEQPNNQAVSEQRLNQLGYELLRAGKKAESVAVFALNAELYPQSSNVYDSLGEAYMESGDKELAVKNYRRSLELDPKNTNAVEMLKKLEQK